MPSTLPLPIDALPLIAPRLRPLGTQAPDRRASPRLQAELDCEQRMDNARYFLLTYDVSTFGVALRHGRPLPLGARVQLALHVPGEGAPVGVEAEVVGWHPESQGLRLAFKDPSLEAVRRIHRYVCSRTAEQEDTYATCG